MSGGGGGKSDRREGRRGSKRTGYAGPARPLIRTSEGCGEPLEDLS